MTKPPFKVRFKAFLVTLWIKSLRVRLKTPESFAPGILGVWHQDLLASAAAFKNWGVHTLVSESSDGDLFATIVQNLGYSVTRGSSTHGATNVRHLLIPLREGHFVGMALDGPRGPAGVVKKGSLWLSKSSNTPLWQISAKYGAHIILKTWDKFVLPLPLTRIDIEIKLSL
jgi:lysophospholipid acyltransferase (LPLAT)-like uncharacterized protein